MDVLIFGGQSNMQGSTEGCPADNEPVSNAWEFRWLTDEIVPLQHPTGEMFQAHLAQSNNGGGSLIPSFCRAYVKETGKEVVAIVAARGNTTIAEWMHGTFRYYYAAQKIRAGIEKAKQLGSVEHIYYIWLQGESDAIIETTEEEYVSRIEIYKNDLKRDFGIERFGIIRVGYFCSQSPWYCTCVNTAEYGKKCDETIMQAQETIVQKDSDFLMLTRICAELSTKPEFITPEVPGHYNNRAMEIIGTEAGIALVKQIKR